MNSAQVPPARLEVNEVEGWGQVPCPDSRLAHQIEELADAAS
ncbi:hypothetical protein [Streptomyces sp. NPDC046862]